MDEFRYIVVDSRICHGKPVFRGTRVLVSDVLELLASGFSVENILEEYPQLSEEMIREALRYAATVLRRSYRVIEIHTR
ncbi:MAG: antitoxin [Thermoprotei archaeon]|nr:MAG: antitoxin [Thermoprotei archaeon]